MISLEIKNKKILKLLNNFNCIGLIFCLLSFYFTYYYYQLFNPKILLIGIILFQIGLSLKIGSLISGIIIQEQLK